MIKCVGWAFIYASLQCTAPPQKTVDTFCQNYRPVYWHDLDTRNTKVQNDINNRKWKRLCSGRAG